MAYFWFNNPTIIKLLKLMLIGTFLKIQGIGVALPICYSSNGAALRAIVATDLAARGLSIPDLTTRGSTFCGCCLALAHAAQTTGPLSPCVVNFQLPLDFPIKLLSRSSDPIQSIILATGSK